MYFLGVVGARSFKDKISVQNLVMSLPDDSVIVTSSCKGVCAWTIGEAKKRNMDVLIYKPDLIDIRSGFEAAKRYYQRNKELVERCDFVHAFISSENGFKGGTRFEVEYAIKIGKPFRIHREGNTSDIVYQFDLSFVDYSNFGPAWRDFFVETLSL